MSDSEVETKVRKSNKRVKKTSDIKKYQKDYREVNKERWMEQIKCDICNMKHTIANTANHKRTWNHRFKELESENAKLKAELKKYKVEEDDEEKTATNSEVDD